VTYKFIRTNDGYSEKEFHDFYKMVDELILLSIEKGLTNFDEILLSLPSIYPSVVLNRLTDLVARGKASEQLAIKARKFVRSGESNISSTPKKHGQSYEFDQLPTPHPLDFEWRFADKAIDHLLGKALEITTDQDVIALFGVPSVFWRAMQKGFPRRIVLFEKNKAVLEFLANQCVPNDQIFKCNLLCDQLPSLSINVVICDPPWYPECIRSFLWSASQFCKLDCHLLLCTPPIGTRPMVNRDWQATINWTEMLGFNLIEMQESSLPYISPHFERNALKAEGLPKVPREWRRADLAVFLRTQINYVPRPFSSIDFEEWDEASSGGTRFRLRLKGNAQIFSNPCLETIIPGDILPSVSRLDKRRFEADVWTSGNRIFRCSNTRLLKVLIQALDAEQPPLFQLSKNLECSLTASGYDLVNQALNQIILITNLEKIESSYYEAD